MNKRRKLTINNKPISPGRLSGTSPEPLLERWYLRVKANWIPIALILLCFLIFNTYTSMRMSGDTFPAGYLPFSIIFYHNLFLEQFSNPEFAANAYAFTTVNGHLMSLFPIVTPVLITPFVWVCTLGMTPTHALLHTTQIARTASAGIAAIAVILFYLVITRFVPKKIAILSTLVFAFATATWSIGSQALWQHGMVELLLLAILYAILRYEEAPSPAWLIAAGIFSGLLAFCRPPDAILLIPVIAYLVLEHRRDILQFIVPAILAGLPFLAYNVYYFGTVTGGYAQNLGKFIVSPDVLANFAGLFISPNKGLFVFSPILILAVFGYFHTGSLGIGRISRLLRWFAPALLLEVAMYAFFSDWGGGYSYGPRFLTSMVPVLCIYVALFLSYTSARFRGTVPDYLKTGIIAILIVLSVIVQFIGVFYFPYLADAHYSPPWDSSNPVILSSLDDGMTNLDTFAVQSLPPLPPLYYYSRYSEWKDVDVQKALAAGDYSAAYWHYVQRLQENPDSYILWNNLGCCLMKLGQYDDAIQSFDRAIAINPGFKEAQANRAAAEQILKQYDRSEAADWTLLFGKTDRT